jgi:cytochrome d ubiquinol oxidase subunit I
MSNLFFARAQMAMSLGFHIVFAVVGMAMPLLMFLAERRAYKNNDPVCLELAKRWSKGTAILFAVGAVSGTVLSFELGLLWPRFMEHAGPIIGMPFSLEGLAFFLEAIFLGIYLYGWDRVPRRVHLAAGMGVFLCGAASGLLVVCANAWMNTPAGFRLEAGRVVDIDPVAAMFNPSAAAQGIHMLLAALVGVGFAVAGVHAFALRKARRLGIDPHPMHAQALRLAILVGGVAAVLQAVSGDYAAKTVARTQPVKLAAMEGQWETERSAPLRVLGWPDEAREQTRYSIEIPYGLSILSYGDPRAEVKGLKEFPPGLRPPVAIVHAGFQIMVMCGMALIGVGAWALWLALRRRPLHESPRFLLAVLLASPLGMIAIEAGWVVTEVGRQPWIVQGVQRTSQAVTNVPYLFIPFTVFTGVYLLLAATVVHLLRKYVFLSVRS